ncbi:MAG: DUF86 domain-containing protein [Candidatus Bathyarchaeota archaeon]|nr:DUF86 domain-containing protein [Candidatus Bathyarchaeota archaeon]
MKKDDAYLAHILQAIFNIENFIGGLTEKEFFENIEKQYAVLRALEIIGEATKNLSPELKMNNLGVDWKSIAGMRDKLIHAYFGINLPLVWETVKKDLPQLKTQVEELLEQA